MVPEKSVATPKKKNPKTSQAKKTAKPLQSETPEEETLQAQPAQEMREPVSTPSVADVKPHAVFKEGDDYTFLVRYDKTLKLFVGEVVEISECKSKGASRDEVLKDLKIKLEDYIEDHRVQGGLPEPVFSKQYPEKLTLTVSQSIYRKLDLLSRMEKIELEQLAVELLSSAADRRTESGKNPQKHSHQGGGPSQQQRHNHHGGRHGGGGHNRNRHNQGNLDSRENFMEYVRNLEKGGNRWKK